MLRLAFSSVLACFVQNHSKGSRTSVRGSDRSLVDPVKEGLDPAYNRLDSLPNNVHRKRSQRVGGKEEPSMVTLSDVKTSKTERIDDAHSKSCQQRFEIQRASDFAKLQRSEWHPKNSLPDGSFKIPRPYTASRSGQSGSTQRAAKAEPIDGLLLSPRLHSSRRTESQRMPSSSVGGLLVKDSTVAQPQRSLESPKSLPPPPSAADTPPVPPATGNNKPVNLKRSGMEVSWTAAGVDPRFGASARGSSNNPHPLPLRFQRQDSVPILRDGGRLHSWQTSGQFQDVSQITAIQVTPRPKPRAFPRTNPSYVASQRRDWVVGGSYRKMSEGNPQRMSPVDVGHQTHYYPGKDRVSSAFGGGAQTLQASHLHYKDPVLAVEAKRAVLKNEDYDSDTSQSSTGSELNYQLRQHALDSKVLRPRANRLVSSLRCSNTGVSQTVAFAAGTLAADCEVASVMSGDLSSPVVSPNFRKSGKSGSYSTQIDVPPPREKPKKATVSHREPVLMKLHRRNSEPDYVNVLSGKEERSASVSQMLKSHGNHQASSSPVRHVDDSLRNGGTLHVQDHSSPSEMSSICLQ